MIYQSRHLSMTIQNRFRLVVTLLNKACKYREEIKNKQKPKSSKSLKHNF